MESEQTTRERAVAFVRGHFRALNEGDAERVRQQLFQPEGAPTKPRDLFVERMIAMGPFAVRDAHAVRYAAPKPKGKHGTFGTVWVEIEVESPELGVRHDTLPIWWTLDDTFLVGARVNHWVLDWLEGRDKAEQERTP